MTVPTGMDRWRGRVALVTGASSGIGAAMAKVLASHGLKVAACARREERLRALQTECPEAQILAIACDLRDEHQIVRAFEQVREAWGGVDVLVNAAGLGYESPLQSGDANKWREILEVNVLAPCIAAREAVADMRRQGIDGQIVHVVSMSGHRLFREDGLYPASKFALRAATETLRRELRRAGSRIRVSALSPGLVETEFARTYYGDARRADDLYGSAGALRPDDVAAALVYVLSQPPHVDVNDIWVRPVEQEA